MKAITRRLTKLELACQKTKQTFTKEELFLGKLALARAIAHSNHREVITDRARDLEDKLSREIVSTASKQRSERFVRHISEYVRPMWAARWGHPDYLPPIVGSEYDDWETRDLFLRRLAVRNCNLVVSLIGKADVAPFEVRSFAIPWGLIFAQLLESAKSRSISLDYHDA